MAVTCAKIASGILFDCPPPPPGVDAQQLVLFNWDDIDKNASVVTKTQMSVLALLGSPAAVGFVYEGINNSVRPNYESVLDGFNPFKYNHNVIYRIFADDETVSDIESDLSGGLFVAVYFTKSQLVKVVGFDVGLRAQVTRDYYEEEGAALITLQTPAEEFETTPALTYIGAGSPIASFDTLKAEIIALT